MNHTKLTIAKFIGASFIYNQEAPYEDILNAIYENSYRTIHKVPCELFLLGMVQSFVIKDEIHANKLLTIAKEVVQEALEMSGIELTFNDEDWDSLKIIANPERWGGQWVLMCGENKLTKSYMSEFFELN